MKTKTKLLIATLAVGTVGCGSKPYIDQAREREGQRRGKMIADRAFSGADKAIREFSWDAPKKARDFRDKVPMQSRASMER